MPRHDRANGVYQQPGRSGGGTSRRATGRKSTTPKTTYAEKQSRAPFVHAQFPVELRNDGKHAEAERAEAADPQAQPESPALT